MSTKRNDLPGPPPPTVTPLQGVPPPFPLPDIDARTHALRQLGRWLCSLVYYRTMTPDGPPQPFALKPEQFYPEQPDSVEGLEFPAFGVVPGRGTYLSRSLGPADVVDGSEGIAGPGTALMVAFDYQELLTLEGWGSKISERRSLVAAVENAIWGYEGTTDLRLILPEYFNQVASFSIMERENIDDPEVLRGRRRVHLFLQLTVPMVRPGYFVQLNPSVTVNLGVGDGGLLAASTNAQVAASMNLQGEAALAALGVTPALMRAIARAQYGLTPLQSAALPLEYLVAVAQTMAAQNAAFETYKGRPPYSGLTPP